MDDNIYLVPKSNDENKSKEIIENKTQDSIQLNPTEVMKNIAINKIDDRTLEFVDSKLSENQIKMFIIAQAKRELQKVIKFSEMLDVVEKRFEERIINNINEVPDYQLGNIMSMIMGCIDRSNSIISNVIKDKELLNLLIIDNSKNLTVNSVDNNEENMMKALGIPDTRSRKNIINAVVSVINNMDKLIDSDK